MLRSCFQFFTCHKNQETNENTHLFAKKLQDEINREIKYRQKYFLVSTILAGTTTIVGSGIGLGLLFKLEKNKVAELSQNNPNYQIDEVDYHIHNIALYFALPIITIGAFGLELSCFYQTLKKYYYYADNAPLTDLSPALYSKTKEYLLTLQHNIENLTLSDLQEILEDETRINSVNESTGFYYAMQQ